jgi:hypothetical protein
MTSARALVLAAVVAAALAVPAGAVPPVHATIDPPVRIVQDQGQACGFPVRWTIDLVVDETRYFDQDGRLVRIRQHLKEDNTITNLATGLTLREGPDSFTQQLRFGETGALETIAISGLAANVRGVDPLKDVGRVVLVPTPTGPEIVFSAGPHPVREAAVGGSLVRALSAFCDVLS